MLKYNFDVKAKLEVQSRKTKKYMTTVPDVFRSWGGRRRVNGKPFNGAVFYYQSNETIPSRDDLVTKGWERKGLKVRIVKPGKYDEIKITTNLDKIGRPTLRIERI